VRTAIDLSQPISTWPSQPAQLDPALSDTFNIKKSPQLEIASEVGGRQHSVRSAQTSRGGVVHASPCRLSTHAVQQEHVFLSTEVTLHCLSNCDQTTRTTVDGSATECLADRRSEFD
jgi:hypothetical protein